MAQVRAIAADSVAWSACVTVCLLVTTTRPTKMDEPIEMMFGERLVWLKKPRTRRKTGSLWDRDTLANIPDRYSLDNGPVQSSRP